jgi:hypothetical protein
MTTQLQLSTVREHTALLHELPAKPGEPFAIDANDLERFVNQALKRVGRRGLALEKEGFYLQIDPLVLLFHGRADAVKRTALLPLAPGLEPKGDDVITFPEAAVLEIELKGNAPIGPAIAKAMEAARAWATAAPENRLGGFVRLYVIPDARAAGGARSVLRIERLTHPLTD